MKLNILSYPSMFLILVLTGWGGAFSQTFNVNCDSGDDLHLVLDGTTLGSGGVSIQSGDVVNVSGTCYVNSASFIVNNSITLNGVAGPSGSKPILDGRGAPGQPDSFVPSVLTVNAPTTVNNLTIQQGFLRGILFQAMPSADFSTLSNSSVINNGRLDGALEPGVIAGSNLNVVNTTLSGNKSGLAGPANAINISQSTITNNLVDGLQFSRLALIVVIDKSIIAGNGQQSGGVDINVTRSIVTLNKSNLYGTVRGNIIINPDNQEVTSLASLNLGALTDNGGLTPTIALNAGSVAINFTPLADCAATVADQRGASRPGVSGAGNKSGCDSGAYESGDAKLVVASSSVNPLVFPAVNVGQSSNAVLTVTNNGNSSAIGSGNYLISNSVFTIASAANALNIPINSSSSLPLMSFTPTQAGVTSNGTISISYNNTAISPLVVSLTGSSNPAAPTPQMKDIIAYFAQGVKDKTIVGLGKTVLLAKLRLIVFGGGLVVTDQYIKNNKISNACLLLRTLIKTSDGQANPSDLIKGSGVPKLNQDLSSLRAYIGCAPIAPLPSDCTKDNDAGTATSQ